MTAGDGGAASGPGPVGAPPRPGGRPPLGLPAVLAAVLTVAAWCAGRFPHSVWAGEGVLVAALAFGAAAAVTARRLWTEIADLLEGPGRDYLVFLAGAVFAGAEAYAVGLSLERGGPVVAAALLVPPVGIALFGLLRAARAESFDDSSGDDRGTGPDPSAEDTTVQRRRRGGT